MISTTFALLALAIAPQAVEIERYQLDNGVRVIIAHVPDAPRQATFTLLPLHMGNDGPDRAQWSHLLEHHLIRSTDPNGLSVAGVDINGETMHHSARLDTIALPEHWPAAIERHGKWLVARDFDEDVHVRELAAIHGEEQAVAMTGWTHKFALAAWNQIVRHGREHARVHGDVADSDVAEVMRYAQDQLPVDDSILIATVGPIAIDEVKAQMNLHIGHVPVLNRPVPGMSRLEDMPQKLTGTWDLPTRHVIVWRRIGELDPVSAAMTLAFGDALQMRLMQDQAVLKHVRMGAVHSIVPTPEGVYFIINAVLQRDAEAAQALASMEKALDAMEKSPMPALMARQLPTRLLDTQILRMYRAQAPEQMAFAVEANWMLQGVLLEYAAGWTQLELRRAIAGLSQETMVAFIEHLRKSAGGVLVLEPAVAGELRQ